MDIATVIGLLMGMILVSGSIMIGGGGMGPFLNVPSIMITIGGTASALLINFPLKNLLGVWGVVRKCFNSTLPGPEAIIKQFAELAQVARGQGMLALEERLPEVQDDFLKRGLELLLGGSSKEVIESLLEIEVQCIEQRHQTGKKIFEAMAAAAPAFGMIGTLIGLVQMLRTLDDPSQIGVGMATALLTTLYGALIANLFCIPLAGKLENRSQEEVLVRQLMIAGIGGLVEGLAPRALEERLLAFLAPSLRPAENESLAA